MVCQMTSLMLRLRPLADSEHTLREHRQYGKSRYGNEHIVGPVIGPEEQFALYSVSRCRGLKRDHNGTVANHLDSIFLLVLKFNVPSEQS